MTNINKKKAQFNPRNERIKYQYRIHQRRVGKKDEKTVIAALQHIREFENFIDFAGFETFNAEHADKYIKHLTGRNLSLSYIDGNIRELKNFLIWLERQHGYRSKINFNHIDYLNISTNQRKEAKAMNYKQSYTYEEILKTIRAMPDHTDKEKRDRAIISLQALCALRISELRTVKLKNLIKENGSYFIYVNPKDMMTKFAKTRHAHFMSLPDDIIENVIGWRDYLRALGFKDEDPLFPIVDSKFTQENLLEKRVTKEGIKSGSTIQKIFKNAFQAAGCEYFSPHSFRTTVARYAERQSPAFLNAVRQYLGHRSIDTTLSSYGQLSVAEQQRVINEQKICEEVKAA